MFVRTLVTSVLIICTQMLVWAQDHEPNTPQGVWAVVTPSGTVKEGLPVISLVKPTGKGLFLAKMLNDADHPFYQYVDANGKLLAKPDGGFWVLGRPFSDGLAAVQGSDIEEPGWYFIDTTGKKTIPGPFLDASDFDTGFAVVQNMKKLWGVIDAKGNFILPCQFAQRPSLYKRAAVVFSPDNKITLYSLPDKTTMPLPVRSLSDFRVFEGQSGAVYQVVTLALPSSGVVHGVYGANQLLGTLPSVPVAFLPKQEWFIIKSDTEYAAYDKAGKRQATYAGKSSQVHVLDDMVVASDLSNSHELFGAPSYSFYQFTSERAYFPDGKPLDLPSGFEEIRGVSGNHVLTSWGNYDVKAKRFTFAPSDSSVSWLDAVNYLRFAEDGSHKSVTNIDSGKVITLPAGYRVEFLSGNLLFLKTTSGSNRELNPLRIIGYINDNDVRIRQSPQTTGAILGKVGRGTKLVFDDVSTVATTIGGYTGFWFHHIKVKSEDDPAVPEGWIFGQFVQTGYYVYYE